MNYINTEIMQDLSEVIPYDEALVPFYIRSGHLSQYLNKRALCHWHDDIELIYVLDGEMNFYINGHSTRLTKNSGIIINTRQMHYGYASGDHDCHFICLVFHPKLLTSNPLLFQRFVMPILENTALEYLYLEGNNPIDQAILQSIPHLTAIREQAEVGYQLEIVSVLHLIWQNIYRKYLSCNLNKKDTLSSDVSIQKDMVSFIYEAYPQKLTLADIAAAGNVSRSKCCKIFKHYLQQSPIDFLNTYRLKIGCHLLHTTDKHVTEIALECGFNHPSYFTELFQRTYDCTPTAYRKQLTVSDNDPTPI